MIRYRPKTTIQVIQKGGKPALKTEHRREANRFENNADLYEKKNPSMTLVELNMDRLRKAAEPALLEGLTKGEIGPNKSLHELAGYLTGEGVLSGARFYTKDGHVLRRGVYERGMDAYAALIYGFVQTPEFASVLEAALGVYKAKPPRGRESLHPDEYMGRVKPFLVHQNL